MKNFIKMLSIGCSEVNSSPDNSPDRSPEQFARTVHRELTSYDFHSHTNWNCHLFYITSYNIFITVLFDCEKKYFHMYFPAYTLRIIFYPQLPWYFSEVFVWLILWLLWTTLIFCWSKMTSIIHWLRSWRTLFPLSHRLWVIDMKWNHKVIISELYREPGWNVKDSDT